LGDSLLYSSRTNRETVVDSIYADLDFAATNCPQPDILQSSNQYGRIGATAALAFKSRVALFEGTWDKFHAQGDANKHLQVAVTAANAVITGGKHSLYTAAGDSSYFYEFQYNGALSGNPIQTTYGPQVNYTYTTNKENIIVRLYGINLTNVVASHSYERGSLEQGNITATKAFVDSYLFTDGLPAGSSMYDSTNNQTSTLTIFRNRDPRIGMTIWNKTLYYPSLGGINLYNPGIKFNIRKYFSVSDWTNQTSFLNFNVLRYAEVLLNYAEAQFELNGSISDADLNLTINALRNRASNNNPSRLPLLTNAFVTTNGLNMETEIRRERSVELAFEGFHYWDELRWKTAETELPQSVLGPKYFPAEMIGVAKPVLDPNGFVVLESSSSRVFNPTRDYLWPLPTKELALNSNLTQNPNW
jgi:starch-binding outer membrane protein, SusD/RagB family